MNYHIVTLEIVWQLQATGNSFQRIDIPDNPLISSGKVKHIVFPGRNIIARYQVPNGNIPVLPTGNIGNVFMNLYERGTETIRFENLPLNFLNIPDTVNIANGQPGGRLIPFDFYIDVNRSYLLADSRPLALRPVQMIPLVFYIEKN